MKAPSRLIGRIVTLLAVIVARIYPATARSAGISLYETGAPDLGQQVRAARLWLRMRQQRAQIRRE